MKELERIFNRIVQRVNINLRELDFDVSPFADALIPPDQMSKFYAFYGITPDHPLDLLVTFFLCQTHSEFTIHSYFKINSMIG